MSRMSSIKERKAVRFPDIGRVIAPELCALPGVLDNISREGCKVHFPIPVVVDLDNDYELRIQTAHKIPDNQLVLLGHPQWVKEDRKMTEIGFKILPSPDYARFSEYIDKLCRDRESQNSDVQIIGSVCRFV
jgi:hypothetical protein